MKSVISELEHFNVLLWNIFQIFNIKYSQCFQVLVK